MQTELDGGGDLASRYHTLRELGRGGMGVVYLAEDRVLQRNVALKILYPALSTDEQFLKRFRQEAQLVSVIADPHVVHINNLAMVDHRLAIDMEYVDGLPLHRYITEEFVTSAVALRVMRDVLRGLSICHHHGLLHCDIKPSNVLLPNRGPAKLVDFGLAHAYSGSFDTPSHRKTTTGVFFGTPVYTPPELWDGTAPSPASDLFSVGVVLYEMLSGEVPYSGPTPLAVIKTMLTTPLPPLSERAPELSAETCELVHRLLEPDPLKRPCSADDVLGELSHLPEFVPEDDNAPTVHITRRTLRNCRQSRWTRRSVVIGLLVVLAVVAVVIFAVVNNPQVGQGIPPEPVSPDSTRSVSAAEQTGTQSFALQADVLSEGLPSAEELLRSWKDDGPGTRRIYAVSPLDERYPGFFRWLVVSTDEMGLNNVIGYSDSGLLRMERLSDEDGVIELRGNWAEYRVLAGSGLRMGDVKGRGEWSPGRTGLVFLLQFVDAVDNTAWTSTVTVRPLSQENTDTQFFYELQSRDAVLPLVYNELLPRRVDWAMALEPELSCLRTPRLRLPLLIETLDVSVDGKLDEPFWNAKYLDTEGNRIGERVAKPAGSAAKLRLRASRDTVFVGIVAPVTGAGDPMLRLAVLPRLGIPASQSDTYIVDIDENGSIAESRRVRGRSEVSWTPDWRVGANTTEGIWSVEIAIPADNMNAQMAGNALWRLNGEVFTRKDHNLQPVHQWGFPDTEDALHGMLAEFEEPR